VQLAEGAGAAGSATLPRDPSNGPNDFGGRDYRGVCPPAGDRPHRYRVTLWALKVSRLAAPARSSAALIDHLIEANAIAHRTLVVRHSR